MGLRHPQGPILKRVLMAVFQRLMRFYHASGHAWLAYRDYVSLFEDGALAFARRLKNRMY